MGDLQRWSTTLADRIKEDFYRLYPYLCRGARNFCVDHFTHFNPKKEIYIGFTDVESECSIRSLRTTGQKCLFISNIISQNEATNKNKGHIFLT